MLTNPPKAMPQPLKKMYAHFVGYYTAELQLRRTYTDLFLNSENAKLLSEGDLLMFSLSLRAWMIQQQFVGIARMMDPPQNRAQENLSLQALVLALPITETKLRDRQLKRVVRIRKAAAAITKHRHKYIAHYDRQYATGQRRLRAVKHAKIDKVLGEIGKILGLIHELYEKSSIDYTPRSLAGPLLQRLRTSNA